MSQSNMTTTSDIITEAAHHDAIEEDVSKSLTRDGDEAGNVGLVPKVPWKGC